MILIAEEGAAGDCSFSSKSGEAKSSESRSLARITAAVPKNLELPKDNQPLAVVPTLVTGLCPTPLRTHRHPGYGRVGSQAAAEVPNLMLLQKVWARVCWAPR